MCWKEFHPVQSNTPTTLNELNEKDLYLQNAGKGPFLCRQGGEVFSQKGQLYVHKAYRHMKLNQNLREKRYACQYCDRRFNSKIRTKEHELTHTNEKPHSCSYCDKKFRLKQQLKRHQLMVHVEEDLMPSKGKAPTPETPMCIEKGNKSN